MKICLNALNLRNHLGGIGWYCFYLAQYLKKIYPSLELTILTHKKIAPQFYPLKNDIRIIEFPFQKLCLKIIYFQLLFPFFIKKRFDILHSVGNIGMIVCPIPQIITICDAYEKVSPQRFGILKRTFMGLMISLSGRRAEGIITISKNTYKDVARFYPYLSPKAQVIYLGNKFYPLKAKDVVYKPDKQFLFVGTIEPGKNLLTVIKAMSLITQRFPLLKVKVIGALGWKQSNIFKMIQKGNLQNNIVFCGYIADEQLKHEYQNSYALICPSLYEGFGLPVIEALACGCPVISAKNSALIEAGGDCVIYFDTENEKDLAEKMLYVYSNPEKIKLKINKGLIHAAQFQWEKTARETFDFYLARGNMPEREDTIS